MQVRPPPPVHLALDHPMFEKNGKPVERTARGIEVSGCVDSRIND